MRNYLMMLVLMVLIVTPALAHEHRHVGQFEIAFGWRTEPALAGQLNGPEVYLVLAEESGEHGHEDEAASEQAAHDDADAEHEHDETEAMIDLSAIEVSLQAELSFGDQTMTLPLRAAFGEVGHYVADLIPMLPGDYSFHITGTIGDLDVDEVFTSADGNFSTVEPAGDVMFPALPAVDNARIAALEARIADLEALVAAKQDQ